MRRKILAAATAALVLLGACSDDSTSDSASTDAPSTDAPSTDAPSTTEAAAGPLQVPADYPTIQAAVDAAVPGDLILVAPGTYPEAVQVETDQLTIRGLDRNTVILDGEFEMDNGIRILGAKGVTVENMTAMNYTKNGFFWTGVDGYHGAYLNTYRTGDYGVYVYDSVNGQLDHLYTAGSVDAGVYIGGCYPCNAVLTDTVSEHNGLGYSGTNSGGNLLIINSVFRNNRAGVVPNSGTYELCYPERETTIVGNLIYSNNQADSPSIDWALIAMGNGIVSAGGVGNDIERNLIYDHDRGGIVLAPYLEEDPNDKQPTPEQWTQTCDEQRQLRPEDPGEAMLWNSYNNRVAENVLEDNREADLIVASADLDESTLGNCFVGNTFTASAPRLIEALAPCEGTGTGSWLDGEYDIFSWLTTEHPPGVDWKTAPLPELTAQENMPDAATAPAHPAVDVPKQVDLASIAVPSKPA
ncbi:MAG: right-handed parallel beta-helix repeat-containing protein [Actinomycetota bacterium]|nr:right-handed parallel beta-helix repeat-containing protein [Actinomycetota bacterium]